MGELIEAHVHKDDYPDPAVGDRVQEDEFGMLELVEVTPAGNLQFDVQSGV